MTVSPAAGVCVVPLVTVPVMVAAEAEAPAAKSTIDRDQHAQDVLRGTGFVALILSSF